MNRALLLALLAGGILLILFGLIAYDSTSSDISRFLAASAIDKSIWLLVGGIAATSTGLVGLSREFKGHFKSLSNADDSMGEYIVKKPSARTEGNKRVTSPS